MVADRARWVDSSGALFRFASFLRALQAAVICFPGPMQLLGRPI